MYFSRAPTQCVRLLDESNLLKQSVTDLLQCSCSNTEWQVKRWAKSFTRLILQLSNNSLLLSHQRTNITTWKTCNKWYSNCSILVESLCQLQQKDKWNNLLQKLLLYRKKIAVLFFITMLTINQLSQFLAHIYNMKFATICVINRPNTVCIW